MSANEPDDSGPSEVHEAIMQATYRALCAHGAADLTVQAIADEFEKSKSLIFYHYDSKEDLLSSFLAYLLTGFKDRVAAGDIDDPAEQLDTLIDGLVFGPEDHKEFQTAMLELRAQAPYNEAYREQLRTNDEYVREIFEGIIENGIERGVFDTDDPSRVAMMLLTTIDGARTRWVVLGNDDILDTTRDVLDEQLHTMLYVDRGAQ